MITANPLIDGLYKITLAPAEVKRRTKELLLKIIGPIEISTARLLPSGGTTGQVLKKASNTNYDTKWADESGGGISDGDKGDITVSSGGTVWTIDNNVVTEAKQNLSDNTINDVSTTKHGYVPKAPNDTSKYLRGDGTWATISIIVAVLGIFSAIDAGSNIVATENNFSSTFSVTE